ncbi:hypothetical protein [Sphingopyxis bauzanensis]|uniref:hypothetical protein n=1 Tax=Sphingopyxis bauzanensis TaxID=651663 RepID=UPI001F37934A|nr:hypothetical protein [Sphingopyxis bauzanensis]
MFRRAEFRLAFFLVTLAAATGLLLSPAQAQFRGGYAFLQAVDSRDGTKATDALKDDPSFVNTRNPDTGETALIIVTKPVSYTHLDVYKRQVPKAAPPIVRPSQQQRPPSDSAND